MSGDPYNLSSSSPLASKISISKKLPILEQQDQDDGEVGDSIQREGNTCRGWILMNLKVNWKSILSLLSQGE
jgi:hypothetical protein